MKNFYTLLFALSIILINPWGSSRGDIWTDPKVLVVWVISLSNLTFLWQQKLSLSLSRSWKISALLWALFLSIGWLATLLSPFPLCSFFGQEQMGDGWLYWFIIATFALSNTLLLRIYPELACSQMQGLLVGGVILAMSIFPQLINWRIDYTVSTGQLLKDNILASTIFREQQPIGLYSHRGHAAFVLAAVAVLTLVARRWGWISYRYFVTVSALIIPALLLTQTRAGILALLCATAYLLGQKYYKQLIPAALACLIVVGMTTTTRQIHHLPLIKQVTSDRVYLWELSSRGIFKSPLLGWGFDGFGIAYPYVFNPEWTPDVVRLGDFSFDYWSKNKQLRTTSIPTYKGHNFLLDTTLSVGVFGLLGYSALFGWCLWQVVCSPYRGIEAVAVAYLVFTLTWFECAQFSHIAWWTLSLWGVNYQGLSDRPLR